MEFISVRDMRTRASEIWQQLRDDGDLIVTSNGRPFALLVSIEGEDVEQMLSALRRTRAQMAVSRLRKEAAASGADRLTIEEIEAEIRQARNDRQP